MSSTSDGSGDCVDAAGRGGGGNNNNNNNNNSNKIIAVLSIVVVVIDINLRRSRYKWENNIRIDMKEIVINPRNRLIRLRIWIIVEPF